MGTELHDSFTIGLKRTRDIAFYQEEDEACGNQRKWFVQDKQIIENSCIERKKVYDRTLDRLFSGSRNFWMSNSQIQSASISESLSSTELSAENEIDFQDSSQRSITSYFTGIPKIVQSKHDLSCSRELTDECPHVTSKCNEAGTAESEAFHAVNDKPVVAASFLQHQLTIDSRGGLSRAFALSTSPKSIMDRCSCSCGKALQSCSDCSKNFCHDCLRICYKCKKFFCRECRMNSFLHEDNMTACYRCLG
ncbi:uncharacterized protein LOC108678867 [Hyalella azteca]|uniref:Uncharacterized protein LOC108678867 n=1 Tax=Hyalella azteca TaxID=294128 RepID=A0A8B7PAT6_HYAAZ|nr:uncharacterized protein LOC108678867 [Hyalella azteca]